MLNIPIASLHESQLRTHFDGDDLDRLTASIQQKGILEPLIVRPYDGPANHYEIVAGVRRYRAAQKVGLQIVPVLVHADISDAQALEMSLMENVQRADIHPLEEARGYQALMRADTAYSPVMIGERLGLPAGYIYKRLKLLKLTKGARTAFAEGRIAEGHAERLARLTADQQGAALAECQFQPVYASNGETEPAPVAQLDCWIQHHTKLDVASEDTQHYFPELAAALEEADVEAANVLLLSESFTPGADLGKNHGVLGPRRWHEIKSPRDRCDDARTGVVVHDGRYRVVPVCATKGCKKHFPTPKRTASTAKASETDRTRRQREQRQQEKETADRAVWDTLRPHVLKAYAAHLKGQKVTPALVLMALERPADVKTLLGVRDLTVRNMGQALALDQVTGYHAWSREAFRKAAGSFGFNLQAFEATLTAGAKPSTRGRTGAKTTRRSTRTVKKGAKWRS